MGVCDAPLLGFRPSLAGLAMAGFLIIVGLTGSLLAFYPELQRVLNPHWYPDREPATWLLAGVLAERVEARDARVQVTQMELRRFDETTTAWVAPRPDPATQQPAELDYSRLLLDPATGEELDRRRYAAITQPGWGNLMDFIYALHYALALGMTGMWILGGCALVWTLDCFVGFYLTFPACQLRWGQAVGHQKQTRTSMLCWSCSSLCRHTAAFVTTGRIPINLVKLERPATGWTSRVS